MKEIEINNIKYYLQENYNDCYESDIVSERLTDYFESFDYVLGDFSYGKLRLKGFYEKDSKKCNKINNINGYKKYLTEYCAYGCKYFLLKKIK